MVTEEIEGLGGYVVYDWEYAQQPKSYPAWLRGVLGDDFFDTVAGVYFPPNFGHATLDVQDAELAVLADLGRLQHVSIGSMQVTDEGLKHLHGLRHLESVYLTREPQVTFEGVEELREALPGCHVLCDEPIVEGSE